MIDGTVYFLEGAESRRVKIGFTRGEAEERRGALQTGVPERLRVVATLPGSLLLEQRLHARRTHPRAPDAHKPRARQMGLEGLDEVCPEQVSGSLACDDPDDWRHA